MPVVMLQQASDKPLLLNLLVGHLRRHKDWFLWLLWSWKTPETRTHVFAYCSRFQHILKILVHTHTHNHGDALAHVYLGKAACDTPS